MGTGKIKRILKKKRKKYNYLLNIFNGKESDKVAADYNVNEDIVSTENTQTDTCINDVAVKTIPI